LDDIHYVLNARQPPMDYLLLAAGVLAAAAW